MQNGRGKIFLEFANNFPLACDQVENEETLNLVSRVSCPSLRLPREKPWDEVD